MSATAVVPATRFQNDVAAGWRHFVSGVRMMACDPLALGVLVFAGALTVFLWAGPVGFVLGIDPHFARQYPWRGWAATLSEPAPRVFRSSTLLGLVPILFSQLLGAAIVAAALGPSSARRRWPAAATPGMPALPLGPRIRVIADVLVLAFYGLIARAAVLWVGGVPLAQALFGPRPSMTAYPEVEWLRTMFPMLSFLASARAAYVLTLVTNTVLGTLFTFPLVLTWATTVRLDGRGLVKVAAAALVVFGAASLGAMAHLAPALLVCLSVSAFLLVRLDDGGRPGHVRTAQPLRFRGSPGPLGPLAQLRRDAWFGPVRRLWWALLLGGGLPLILTLVSGPKNPGRVDERAWLISLAALLGFLQWPTLLLLTLYPFGLALVARGTSASGLFSGAFLRSWSALPVRPESVIRAVYAHGLRAAGFAWLVLVLQVRLFGMSLRPVLYELPAVFLMAAIAVCEAVGDRRRGFLAVGGLAGFQFGVPFVFALLPEVLGSSVPFTRNGMAFGVAGSAVGLAGALPALVHLRGRGLRPAVQG